MVHLHLADTSVFEYFTNSELCRGPPEKFVEQPLQRLDMRSHEIGDVSEGSIVLRKVRNNASIW